jgi:tetratricopeptide (TPR) repeat protein
MISRRLMPIVFSLLCLFPALLWADGLDRNFELGNEFYIEGDYTKAISEYEKILKTGYHSAELYYNLGNACFRDGQLGLAVANYIRAKRLAPRDEDIRVNLEFARRFAIDKIEVTEETILLDYINRFFDSFSLNEITTLAIILYILTAAVILVRFIYRRIYIYTPVVVILLALFFFSAVFTAVKLERDVLTRTGVVLDRQAEVKNGPGDDFSNQFTAHAGLMFRIEREESGYFLVNFENRLKGWILKEAIAEI